MCDEPKPSTQGRHAARTTRSLMRIADALGVPVAHLHGRDDGEAMIEGGPDEAAVLTLVQAYLQAADPATRARFVEAVLAMTEPGER